MRATAGLPGEKARAAAHLFELRSRLVNAVSEERLSGCWPASMQPCDSASTCTGHMRRPHDDRVDQCKKTPSERPLRSQCMVNDTAWLTTRDARRPYSADAAL